MVRNSLYGLKHRVSNALADGWVLRSSSVLHTLRSMFQAIEEGVGINGTPKRVLQPCRSVTPQAIIYRRRAPY